MRLTAIAVLSTSAIREIAAQEPAEAAQAIIELRAELESIYAAVDHSDGALYNAVKHSMARMDPRSHGD